MNTQVDIGAVISLSGLYSKLGGCEPVECEVLGKVEYVGSDVYLMDRDYYALLDLRELKEEDRPLDGAIVKVKGLGELVSEKRGFKVVIRVTECETKIDEDEIKRELLNQAIREYRGSLPPIWTYLKDVLERKGFIKMALVYGIGAQVQTDFKKEFLEGLGKHKDKVVLVEEERPLYDESLAEYFNYCDEDIDLFCVIRGGGSDSELQAVGGVKTLQAVINKRIKLVLALGHSSDMGINWLKEVALFEFSPPAALGSRLRELLLHLVENRGQGPQQKHKRNSFLLWRVFKF